MTTESSLSIEVKKRPVSHLAEALTGAAGAILLALILRAVIYIWMKKSGYFYGTPWDTFTRTVISFYWSQKPFLFTPNGYWLPLQFWVVGLAYHLLSFSVHGTEILVPVAVNNLFLAGSLFVTYLFAQKIGGKAAGFLACLIAGLFSGDILISYSALSEPALIFFTLCAGYSLLQSVESAADQQSKFALKAGFFAFLAAATHYIGWFLALFVGLSIFIAFVRSLQKRAARQPALLLLAGALCALAPVVWLLYNYFAFEDLLFSFHNAKAWQANYAGQMNLLQRLQMPALVLLKDTPVITIAGFFSLAFTAGKNPRSLLYAAGPAFMLGMIWFTTSLGISAPYQEPRYLVFCGWAAIPFIASAGIYFWRHCALPGRSVLLLILLAGLAVNIQEVRSFNNYFGLDVQKTASEAKAFLERSPQTGRVILETDSFAEEVLIPVAGYYFFDFKNITRDALIENSDHLKSYFSSFSNDWLAVIKSQKIAEEAKAQGLTVRKVGEYYWISPEK